MKRTICLFFMVILICYSLMGCGKNKGTEPGTNNDDITINEPDTTLTTSENSFKRGVWIPRRIEISDYWLDIVKPEVVRLFANWLDFERERGQLDSMVIKNRLNEIPEHIDIMLHLTISRGWMTGHPEINYYTKGSWPPVDTADFRTAMEFMVRQTASRVKYYQLINEPNTFPMRYEDYGHWNGTVEELKTLTDMFYDIVKELDPKAQVILCGLAPSADIADWGEQLKDCKFDIWDVHINGHYDPSIPINALWDVDRSKELALSECTWPKVENYDNFEEFNAAKVEYVYPLYSSVAEMGAKFAIWTQVKMPEEVSHPGHYLALFDQDWNPYEIAYAFGALADSSFDTPE
ncbi:MAG: hypothetical protein GF307_07770 [candidate division Zixibacteria bacterium]|nr:hypothetical protein [candidate division Zixibacteria bacterium]